METEKKTYTSPQMKKIYAAPLLTKHGMVAQLTGSVMNQDLYNGHNNNRPPTQSAPIVPGNQQQQQPQQQQPQQQQPQQQAGDGEQQSAAPIPKEEYIPKEKEKEKEQ
jgi:hypothetical protein